jgi:hypothetical protein
LFRANVVNGLLVGLIRAVHLEHWTTFAALNVFNFYQRVTVSCIAVANSQ